MNNTQQARMMSQLARMFKAGGATRWVAIAIAIGFVALLFLRPDLLGEKAVRTVDGDRSVATRGTEELDVDRTGDANTGVRESPVDGGLSDNAGEADVGQLVQVSEHVYRSSGGLHYGRGSRHGNRLDHVLAHGKDERDRAGSHGVYDDGSKQAVVAIIDEAYHLAQQGGSGIRKKVDGDRTVYTVDMGRDIGYVGGQSGNRRGRPRARHLRLVLEQNRVITAYPLIP